MIKGLVMRVNGRIEEHDFEEPEYRTINTAIRSEMIEIVRLKKLPNQFVMVVDEEGLCKDKPLNVNASFLYGTHIHGSPIVGDVAFVREGYTDDGIDFVDCNEVQRQILKQFLESIERG